MWDSFGEVLEWLNRLVSKTSMAATSSGVRIPPSPHKKSPPHGGLFLWGKRIGIGTNGSLEALGAKRRVADVLELCSGKSPLSAKYSNSFLHFLLSILYYERISVSRKALHAIMQFTLFSGLLCIIFIHPPSVTAVSETTSVIPSSYRNLGTPSEMLLLDNGDMWYVDSRNYRLVRVAPDGTIIRTIGREGTGDGEFENQPHSITQDEDGNLYVSATCRVYVFEPSGAFKYRFGECNGDPDQMGDTRGIHYSPVTDRLYISDLLAESVRIYTKDGTFESSFGSAGTGNGQFDDPYGITTVEDGNIYVMDTNNHRAQKFTSTGTFITSYGSGSGPEELVFPKDMIILDNGDVLIASQNGQRVKRFANDGTYLSEWGQNGSEDNQFVCPQYMEQGPGNTFWMNDCALFRLQQFTYDGTLQDIIQNSGTTNGTFTQPIDLDFDSAGNLYVLDGIVGNNRVQRFDINGNYVSTPIAVGQTGWASFHIHVDDNDNIYVSNEGGVVVYTTDGTYVRTIGTGGNGDGQFNQARGVATASNGNIYVADMANSRVQVFDQSGTYLFQFGSLGTADGEFDSPTDIYITDSDEVYVGSNFDDYRGGGAPRVVRVQVFDLNGNFIRALDATNQQFAGDPNIHQYQINGLEVDNSGNVFITDGYLDRIIQYDTNGAFVERIGQRGGEYSEFFGVHHARFHPVSGALYVA